MCRLALTGALLLLCTNTAAGCRQQEKQEVTPEVLMDAVDKNMKEVNSASSSLEIEVELEDVEADSGGETEAGTTQRDVVRHGVARIPVSFSVTAKWLKKLAGYAKKDKISVQYFDVETVELKLAEMYVTGYKAKLKKDTSYKGLWTVSFTLKEM